jgi:dihydrofolate reductase
VRQIIVAAEVSFDGVMGGEDVSFWEQVFNYHSDDVSGYLNDLLFASDALLMGRKTYEYFAQVWSTREGKDAERINSMPKYVVSRALKESLDWNAKLIEGDVAREIDELKQQPGKDLLQYGVGELTHTMLRHGLIDELRLMVFPFTFGNGSHIFESMGTNKFNLLSTKSFTSGAIALHYQPLKGGNV